MTSSVDMYAEGESDRPVEIENAPCSMASDARRCIADISSGVTGLFSVAPTAIWRAACPSCGATFRPIPLHSRAVAHPSRSLHSHSVGQSMLPIPKSALPSGPIGNGEKLQLPITSVVTPW